MMNRRRIVACLLSVVFTAGAVPALAEMEEPAMTTVIVVRHAEKLTDSDDPGLSSVGEDRSRRLRNLALEAGVTAVYASQFLRTQATVRPLAEALDLEIDVVDAREPALLARAILSEHAGEVVAVGGHSNTVPAIVAALGAPEPAEIPETDYGNLFIVTVSESRGASVLRLRY
jgi:broad specificity phosphatase PhoE